jgi:hypothetical protein
MKALLLSLLTSDAFLLLDEIMNRMTTPIISLCVGALINYEEF